MFATSADAEARLAATPAAAKGVSVRASSIVALLLGLLVVQNVLLWPFLGLPHWWLTVVAVATTGVGCAMRRYLSWPGDCDIDGRLIAFSFAVSVVVFVLGGEGRFFYQTSDWQVRNAVLHDLVVYPWPFAYATSGQIDLLRAPVGLYLLPALVGKAGGLRCAELCMLLQSALFLSGILSLGAGLFDRNSKRLMALLIFLAFSGMDVVGTWLVGGRLDMHLEGWSGVQFSSTLTLAYWVPMHALAGWMGAVLYLLWRTGRVPLFAFLAPLPLLALLSPLALLGVMPFAALAGISAIRSRTLRVADVAVPLGMLLVSVPSLLYLASGAGAVAPQVNTLTIPKWAVFEIIEVLPYLLAVLAGSGARKFGEGTLAVTLLLLLALPWGQIGSGPDIPMRASIPALAILAVLVADLLVNDQRSGQACLWQGVAITMLLVGSATPLSETLRAIHRPRQQLPTCSYFGVVPNGSPTYVAPLERVSRLIAPSSPTLVHPTDDPSCREIELRQMELRYVGPQPSWRNL